MKQDAVPGHHHARRASPPTGRARIEVVCAELCGIGHATMRQQVRVVPTAEFDDWVKERAEGGAAPAEGESPMAAGREIFTSAGCNACHTLADADATGGGRARTSTTSPPWPSDREKGTSAEDYVQESIVDPPGVRGEGLPRGYHARRTSPTS